MAHGITGKNSWGGINSSEKERDSNIELFRIITMLLIIAHHYVVNSGLTAADGPIYSDPLSWRALCLLVYGAWGKIGINCFVFITGYYMCTSHITEKKWFKLLLEVMFYRIVINCLFLLIGYKAFEISDLLWLIPVTRIGTGFPNAFLVFYLCIPFINILIHSLSERQHVLLLLLCFFTYIVLGTIPFFSVEMNYVSWFTVVYFISSYVRLYPKNIYSNKKVWKIMTASTVIISIISVCVCTWLGTIIHRNLSYGFVSDSNALLAVITSFSLFILFKNTKIGYSKTINTIAATTFGIFLIHTCGDTMRQWLWRDVLNNVAYYYSPYMPIHAIASVLAVFLVCMVIDYMRARFIEKPFFLLWDKLWEKVSKKYIAFEVIIASKLGIQR